MVAPIQALVPKKRGPRERVITPARVRLQHVRYVLSRFVAMS